MSTGRFSSKTIALLAAIAVGSADSAGEDFVSEGRSLAARQQGERWETGKGFIQRSGEWSYLFADALLGPGDFHVRARLSIQQLNQTAATFELGKHAFCFDHPTKSQLSLRTEIGEEKANRYLGPAADVIAPRKPFAFEAIRGRGELSFRIDGREVFRGPFPDEAIGKFGFRPWRSTMRVYDFSAVGNLEPWVTPVAETITLGGVAIRPGSPPPGLRTLRELGLVVNDCMSVQRITRSRSYENRAVITPGGDFLFMCVMGRHYGPPGGAYGQKLNKMIACRSSDRGQTWTEPTVPWEVPYAQHGFVPLIPRGGKRLYCFGTEPHPDEREGRENCAIAYRYSDDDGFTWSEPVFIRPQNDPDYKGMSVMRMCQTDAGTWLLGTHAARWEEGWEDDVDQWSRQKTGRLHTRLYVLRSEDRGRTWTLLPDKRPHGWYADGYSRMDEGRPINLGGGKVMIMARTPEGHLWQLYSDDDGKTWTDPRPTPLVHPDAPPMLFHLSDGKTLVAFHHNKYDPAQPHFNSRWARNELWCSVSKDDGATWSEPRFVLADASPGDRRQVSYADLIVDGNCLHLFVSPNWEGALHIRFQETDLPGMPTTKDLLRWTGQRGEGNLASPST